VKQQQQQQQQQQQLIERKTGQVSNNSYRAPESNSNKMQLISTK
jgi:hypothetical protein